MSVTNPLKGRSEYRYNTQGSLVSHTHPNGAITKYHYDREGKITQKSNALGDSSYLLYDTQKRVQASIDAHQSKTEYFYDKTDRIIKTKDGINNEIHYQYNTQARLYRITDPVGNDTKYFYDNAGRLEQELSPSKELSVRSYNPDNTLNSITRRDNSEIVFTYNALRVPSEILYTSTHSRTQKTQTLRQSFGYDRVGRLTQASDAHSLVRLGYNRIGKINQEQQFFKAFTIQKTSDAKTHTDTLSFAGTTVQITHDFTTRTKTLTKNNRYPITIHYDTQGIETKIVYPNGLEERYTFNPTYQLIAIETAYQRLSYQYDKVGNIVQKSGHTYRYDAIGRVIQANQHSFVYDKAGNNQNDYARYDQTTYQLLENQRYRFTYDRRGNLQTKTDKPKQETTYYRFNLLNQLTEVIIKDRDHRTIKTFRYEYDALNRRIMKQEDNQTYYYLYDGLNIIAILSETKQVLATIVHHDTKIDTPLSIHTIYGIFYYHRDHQGSIIALSDEYGDIVESIEYDGHYGSITKHWIREDIKTLNPFGYTGREMDRHDLYYYRARYYDPTVQRFLSLDPIGFLAGDFNFYRYVGNSPVVWKDSLGLQGEFTQSNQKDWSNQASYQNTNPSPKPENYTLNVPTIPTASVDILTPSSSDYIDSFEGTSYDPKYDVPTVGNIPSKDTPQPWTAALGISGGFDMWGLAHSREMGVFRSKVCNADGTTTLKRGIYKTKEVGIDVGKDSVKVDSTGKKPVVEISPNADLGATAIVGWKDSETVLNGNSLNEGGTAGSYTFSRGSAQNEDGSYSPAAVMIDYDLLGKDTGGHKKYGTGYTTCEEEYVGMSWDNWDGWSPLLEEDGTWDCDYPEFYPYGDTPTVPHDVAEANKKAREENKK